MAAEETLRQVALTLLRFSAFSAHAVLFGLVPVILLVLRPSFAELPADEWDPGRRSLAARLEGLVKAALIASAVATALFLLLQSALVSELANGEVTTGTFLSVLETTFGQFYALRFPFLAALAVLLVGRVREWSLHRPLSEGGAGDAGRGPSAVWWVSWALLGVGLLATSTFSGHAQVATPRLVSLANDLLHLVVVGTWFTGIVVLAVALPDGWIAPGADRLRLLAPTIGRFSRVALVTIVLAAVTGTINSFLHLGRFADLWSSGYGRTLGIKIILFVGILVLGGINHLYVRDKLAQHDGESEGARRLFRRTIATELVIALALMAATGLLTGLGRTKTNPPPPPPGAESAAL